MKTIKQKLIALAIAVGTITVLSGVVYASEPISDFLFGRKVGEVETEVRKAKEAYDEAVIKAEEAHQEAELAREKGRALCSKRVCSDDFKELINFSDFTKVEK